VAVVQEHATLGTRRCPNNSTGGFLAAFHALAT
jgi:hypothetical protein